MIRPWPCTALLIAGLCLACPAAESSKPTAESSKPTADSAQPTAESSKPTSSTAVDEPAPEESPPPAEPETPKGAHELLAGALLELSEQPAWLGEDPAKVHKELPLGEHFELHRYSEGMGETERVGFSIRPKQTELNALDFAEALGLEAAAHQRVPITDRNRERLANLGLTPFVWKGLQLEIELHKHGTGLGSLGLNGWAVDDVLVLPAELRTPEPVDTTSITITPDQAAAAGLARLGFSLDITGTGMSGTKLGQGEYLHLSGPPGGPMILRISPATFGSKFEKLIRDDHRRDAELVEAQVELLGGSRRAAAWVNGEGLAKTSWCAVILGPGYTKPETPVLLLEVGIGYSGDAVACKTALEDPNIKPVLDSLTLTTP